MINTKLVLIEGLPGSGKSTTAYRLAEEITRRGQACECFLEWDAHHPLAIGDDLHLGEVIRTSRQREGEMLEKWRQFAQAREAGDKVTVLESRFWQTSVMLMYAAGLPVEGVFESNRRVAEAIGRLDPALIYFVIEDVPGFSERVIQTKEAEWRRGGFPGSWTGHLYEAFEGQAWFTERGLSGLEGMLAYFEEWARISEDLYRQAPFRKIKIANPYLDWELATRQMQDFLALS